MKKIILLIGLLLPLLSFTAAHKFYVSVTDIKYKEDQHSLQIISRVFTDDLELLLQTRYSDKLYLTKEKEHPEANAFIKRYFEEKFEIAVNGETQPFKYLGKQYENDQVHIYLEAENVEIPRNIQVKNEVLTDLYPDQKNVIKIENAGNIKSLLLEKDKPRGKINFENWLQARRITIFLEIEIKI